MTRRDNRDMLAGILLTAIGLFAAWYAAMHYDVGALRKVGPGMFPAATGMVMAALGLMVAIPAALRAGEAVEVRLRPLAASLAALLAFGLLIKSAGLVPAVYGLVLVAAFAERPRWSRTVALATVLAVGATLIFKIGLGLQVPIAAWPL